MKYIKSIHEALSLDNGAKDNVIKAINYIRQQGSPNPFNGREIVLDNKVIIEISYFDGALWISSIFSMGEGGGRLGMKTILDAADKFQVICQLSPEPYSNNSRKMTKTQLKNWYKKLGFKTKFGDRMERLPKKK